MARSTKIRSRWRRWSIRLAFGVLAAVTVSILMVLPLRWIDPVTSSFMLQDDSGRDPMLHAWVSWEHLGSTAALAVVAAEDQRFADHFGLDLSAISKSIEEQDKRGGLRGASTISQQVTKNLFLWSGRSFIRKGLEAWLTVVSELCLPKDRILEIYLNIAEFGPGVYGTGAASSYYFQTVPSRLTDSEAALLAAVLPSPRRLHVDSPSEYVRDRQRWILAQMHRLRREGWFTRLQ